jgi:hypothetical protein
MRLVTETGAAVSGVVWGEIRRKRSKKRGITYISGKGRDVR